MNKTLFFLVSVMMLAVIASNYYIFYYQKDYDFIVEAPCDPATQTCFVRDCDSDEGCPPNNLTQYRIFHIKAGDFAKCTDGSCLRECDMGTIKCVETKCGDSADDACLTSENQP